MKKKLLALGMALFVFSGSSMTALAAVCPHPKAPGGVHHFNSCKPTGGGRTDDLGYHSYLYGYDENNNPIYKNCKMTQPVQYCIYVCYYCGQENLDGTHEHKLLIQHSVNHN